MLDFDQLVKKAADLKASDIHLTYGLPPTVRIDGVLTKEELPPLSDAEIMRCIELLADEDHLGELRSNGESDFAVSYNDLARFRCNIFKQKGHPSAALRLLPMRVPTAEELQVPSVIVQQADKPRGLVLITGPTGSGKSTTLATLLDHINRHYKRHVITLESPIEYVYENNLSIIDQREIGSDTKSFARGLRASLRQDPDVILVGEMRDQETMETAIMAAETGHLVFATLHTKSAAETVSRIVNNFPVDQQEQIRIQLAQVLECVVCQALVPRIRGGRIAAHEIMIATPAIRGLINQNKEFQITGTIQTSRRHGMQLLDDALMGLIRSREIRLEDALPVANNAALLEQTLGKSRREE
ncbi:MAG: type IV pilus twitching motility protein PilT [Clostridia bacterium]|nr:type IV pilus twitching motility protein PilT [Clostridia bacterium]